MGKSKNRKAGYGVVMHSKRFLRTRLSCIACGAAKQKVTRQTRMVLGMVKSPIGCAVSRPKRPAKLRLLCGTDASIKDDEGNVAYAAAVCRGLPLKIRARVTGVQKDIGCGEMAAVVLLLRYMSKRRRWMQQHACALDIVVDNLGLYQRLAMAAKARIAAAQNGAARNGAKGRSSGSKKRDYFEALLDDAAHIIAHKLVPADVGLVLRWNPSHSACLNEYARINARADELAGDDSEPLTGTLCVRDGRIQQGPAA